MGRPARAASLIRSTVSHTEQAALISLPGELPPLLAALDRSPEVSIDTEADNLFRYRTRVCLMQIHAAGETFLLDLLAAIPLDPLWERLKHKHIIMHGSDYDLRLLYEEYGFVATSMFDTMLAAQLLNRPRFGLAPLLLDHFGVALSKEGQKANWSKRPIVDKQLTYASKDVLFLPALRDLLLSELEQLGRVDWLRQKCDWQIRAGLTGFPKPDENSWRIGKSEHLRSRGLCVLFDLWHWREKQAERIDTPPFKVVGNDMLLHLAAAADAGQALDAFANLHLGKRERLRDLLLAELEQLGRVDWQRQKCDWQIRAGLTGFPKPDENSWRIGKSEHLRSRGLCVLYDLWHWREKQAERIDTPPFKVVGNDMILHLAAAADAGQALDAFATIHLGKRERIRDSFERALHAGLDRDPSTLPRRRSNGNDRQPLSARELERQDRIHDERDRLAKRLNLDPTLIASRAQLAQLAREPEKLGEILLPWQAKLLQDCPAFAHEAAQG